jgi:hypothetical protein
MMKKIINTKKYLLNRKIKNYLLATFLVLAIGFSFLAYAFYNGYYSIGGNSVFSSSESKAVQWMNRNLSEKSAVVALSQDSYRKLTSVFSGKVLPLFLDNTGGRFVWPTSILINSSLPEAVLYTLNQLGADYIFVSESDSASLSKSNSIMFVTLMSTFPIIFKLGDITIYDVPKYPVYEDSNYHIVSGMWNFPNVKLSGTFDETNNPLAIDSLEQSNFWETSGYGAGTLQSPITSVEGNTSKITLESGGSFAGWKLYHSYAIPQNWSGYDFISFNIYGNNTGKKFAMELFAPDEQYWTWTDNWAGWDTLAFPLDKPDGQLGHFDLANITTIVLESYSMSDWFSQTGVFYIGNLSLSQARQTQLTTAEQPNLLLSEMLFNGSSPYSIISDSDLSNLTAGEVYIFPSNPRLSEKLMNNFAVSLSNGANVIFLDPLFGSLTALGEPAQRSLNIFDFQTTSLVNQTVTQIVSGNIVLDASFPIMENLSFNNPDDLQFLGKLILSDNSSVPLVVQERVGNGTITFVNANSLAGVQNSIQESIVSLIRKQFSIYLPEPTASGASHDLPIPNALFTAYASSGMELWNNRNLLNKIMFEGDVNVAGNYTVKSNLMYLNCPFKQSIEDLTIKYGSDVLLVTNKVFDNFQIQGDGILTSIDSELLLPNYPGGIFSLINATSLNKDSKSFLNFTNADITLTETDGNKETFSNCSITITINETSSFTLRLRQPAITFNGSLSSTLQGAFIDGNKSLIALLPSRANLTGAVSLNVLYSSGIMFADVELKNGIGG